MRTAEQTRLQLELIQLAIKCETIETKHKDANGNWITRTRNALGQFSGNKGNDSYDTESGYKISPAMPTEMAKQAKEINKLIDTVNDQYQSMSPTQKKQFKETINSINTKTTINQLAKGFDKGVASNAHAVMADIQRKIAIGDFKAIKDNLKGIQHQLTSNLGTVIGTKTINGSTGAYIRAAIMPLVLTGAVAFAAVAVANIAAGVVAGATAEFMTSLFADSLLGPVISGALTGIGIDFSADLIAAWVTSVKLKAWSAFLWAKISGLLSGGCVLGMLDTYLRALANDPIFKKEVQQLMENGKGVATDNFDAIVSQLEAIAQKEIPVKESQG